MLTINGRVFPRGQMLYYEYPPCVRWELSGRQCYIRYATPHKTVRMLMHHNSKISIVFPRDTILVAFYPLFEDENEWNRKYRPSPLTLKFLASVTVVEHKIETPEPYQKFLADVGPEPMEKWTWYENPNTESSSEWTENPNTESSSEWTTDSE